jgi:nucleotide-binding universal stress UspA family protein
MGESARIVVGVDLSDWSQAALECALTEANLRRAQLDVVSAVPDAQFWPSEDALSASGAQIPSREQRVDRVREDVERLVAEVVAKQRAEGVPIRVRAVQGAASQVLTEEARGADLLVVGHRGRGGFASAVLGSVGLHSVLNAPCPVLVVRPTLPSGE